MAPIAFGSWQADYPDPHNFVFTFLHSAGYYGRVQGYANPRMDALIESAQTEPDEKKRGELYRRIQELADADVPSVTIADAPSFRVQRSWVRGFVFKPIFPDMPFGGDYYDLSKSETPAPLQ
jgi:peptide/nickel transport system substrate-binding protein